MQKNVLFKLFLLLCLTSCIRSDGFFDGFVNFIDNIGDMVESVDLPSMPNIHNNDDDSNNRYSYGLNRNTYYERHTTSPSLLETLLMMKMLNKNDDRSLYNNKLMFEPVSNTTMLQNNMSYELTIDVIILKYAALGITATILTFFLLFFGVDIIKKKCSTRRYKILIVGWFLSMFACAFFWFLYQLLKLAFSVAKAFFPYFWPVAVTIVFFLLLIYTVNFCYKKSGYKIIKNN